MSDSTNCNYQYGEISKIDAHVHLNSDRPALHQAAEEERFELVTINTEVPEFPDIRRQQAIATGFAATSKGNLHFLTTFSSDGWDDPDWSDRALEQIKTGIKKGAIGVKIWKNFGMELRGRDGTPVTADHPKLDPIYRYLSREAIPLLAHLGEPRNCWLPVDEMTVLSDRDYFSRNPRYHMYQNQTWPDYAEQLAARDRVLARHSKLRFIGAHLASLEWSTSRIASWLDQHPNSAVDLAERVCHLQHQASEDHRTVRDFVEAYSSRLIYGSDHIDDGSLSKEDTRKRLAEKWRSEFRFFCGNDIQRSPIVQKPFRGLGLGREILEQVFRTNALSYYPGLRE